jgi:tol-pal system protein YbgF
MRAQVFAGLSALALVLAPVMGSTQTREETLADVRQQLSVLYVEIQQLKRDLSPTGAPGTVVAGASTLERVDVIEQQLQVLTNKSEELQYRVERIDHDATNRIGDLEFRLLELEGGDLSQLGESTTLGGVVEAAPEAAVESGVGSGDGEPTELAVGEETDFNRAVTALDNAEFASAAAQFSSFVQTYPGSPLEPEAHLRRGQALEGVEDRTGAARAFLESYSGAPLAGTAPEALFRLGKSLGTLGQVNEACVTLNEVGVRFPGGTFVTEAQSEMAELQCP